MRPAARVARLLLNLNVKDGSFRWSAPSFSAPYCRRDFNSLANGKVFYIPAVKFEQALFEEDQPLAWRLRSFEERMRSKAYGRENMNAYRREPYQPPSEWDIQEEIKRLDLDPAKFLKKDDPNTMQAVIRDVMPVGYFVTLPTGREGYLPASDFGFTGGLAVLRKLYQVGQEITVRITERGGGGREILSMKRPDAVPANNLKGGLGGLGGIGGGTTGRRF